MQTAACFHGRRVIVTEKMDGENCTIGRDYTHARSTDGGHHPSRSWVKSLQAEIGHQIPDGVRLCGENLYAKHSIEYRNLPSYFLLFSIWERDLCWAWDATMDFALHMLPQIHTVPVIYYGPWNEDAIKRCWTGASTSGSESEGYVVRLADSFHRSQFQQSVAKYVRAQHVQTDEHWMHGPVIPNRLR